jgi:uncharacterized membrane protein
MLENQSIEEVAVDRREEIVRTEQPGYKSTQQVTQDVAGEHRLQLFQITRIMWMVLGVLEIMLGLRFILKLMAANPSNGFAGLVYGITGTFTRPFDALLGTPAIDGSIFEATTLIAMSVYAILFGFVARLMLLIADRPRARSVARSVQEQTSSGVADINLDRIDRTDQAESINVEQSLADFSLAHPDRTDQAESINVEQSPADFSLAHPDRTNQAESINVVKLPIDVNSPEEDLLIRAYIDPTDQPQIISVVKLPIEVISPVVGSLIRAYAEFLGRYRRAITIAKPVITLNGVDLETQTADVGL